MFVACSAGTCSAGTCSSVAFLRLAHTSRHMGFLASLLTLRNAHSAITATALARAVVNNERWDVAALCLGIAWVNAPPLPPGTRADASAAASYTGSGRIVQYSCFTAGLLTAYACAFRVLQGYGEEEDYCPLLALIGAGIVAVGGVPPLLSAIGTRDPSDARGAAKAGGNFAVFLLLLSLPTAILLQLLCWIFTDCFL